MTITVGNREFLYPTEYPPILESVFDDVAPDAINLDDIYGLTMPIVSLSYRELLDLNDDFRSEGISALIEGFAHR